MTASTTKIRQKYANEVARFGRPAFFYLILIEVPHQELEIES